MRRRLALATAIALGLCGPSPASAQWREHGSEVLVAGDYKRWDDDRPAWREALLAARHNTPHGVGIVRLSHVERGTLDDNRVELEAYPLFRGGHAALGAGFADGDVYARSTWSAELYANLTRQVEASAGVRRMNFASSVTILTSSLGLYHRDYLFGTRVHHVLDESTLVAVSARRYFGSEAQHHLGAQLAGGTAPAEFRTASDLAVQASRSLALDGQFVIGSRWVLRARAEIGTEELDGQDASMFSAGTLGFGVRF